MKRNVLWISVAGFAIIWFCLHVAVLYDEGISLQQSWFEALALALMIALFLAGTGFTLRLSKPGISRAFTLTLGNLLLAFGSIKLSELFSEEFLGQPLYITASTHLPYYFLVLLIFVIFQTFGFFIWFMQLLAERNIEQKRRSDEKELIRQAQLSELRQQLQPHFLFNSLNSIQALLQFDPQAASMMLQTLADFLRGSVNKTSTQFRSFEEEIRHLRLYLDIEAIRFEDRLNVEMQISENAMDTQIPALMLQPLTENAIKFGLYGNTGSIKIRLVAEIKNGYLKINIENPYDAETSPGRKGTGFGLNSVSRRLQLLYNRNDLIKISKKDGVFNVELLIPVKS